MNDNGTSGIYADIANDDYHAGPGISKSGLDLVAKSPAHYLNSLQVARGEPTPAMRIGTAVHTAVLEPDLFGEQYAVLPDGIDRRTKAGKEAWAEFVAANENKDHLKADEHDQIQGMRDAVYAHPAARRLLEAPGAPELSAYWTDPETGVLCRCRPDFWRDDGILVDLKTTEDASPEGFASSINRFRYHVQAPWYVDGCMQALVQGGHGDPRQAQTMVFIAVEKKPPYAVAVYSLDDETLAIGRDEYLRDLKVYAECSANDDWPGYGSGIQRLGLPDWRLRREAYSK